jgi:hypothetical protein
VAAEATGFDDFGGIGNHGQQKKGQQHRRKISLIAVGLKMFLAIRSLVL